MKNFYTIVLLLLISFPGRSQITNSIEGKWGYLSEMEECISSKDYLVCLKNYCEYIITKDSIFSYVPEIDSLFEGTEIKIKNNQILSFVSSQDSVLEVHFSFDDKNRLTLNEPIGGESITLIKIRNDLNKDLSNNLKDQLTKTYYIIANLEADFYTIENIKRFHQTLIGLEIFTWDNLELITHDIDLPKPIQLVPVKE